jgi:hypothetical protein
VDNAEVKKHLERSDDEDPVQALDKGRERSKDRAYTSHWEAVGVV